MPYPRRFRLALVGGAAGQAVRAAARRARAQAARRHAAACACGAGRPRSRRKPSRQPARGARGRVALLAGCVNDVLAPQINAAAIRVLTRHGIEVVVAAGRRLLRLAGPPHGPRATRRWRRRAPISTPGRRSSGARRHRDHRLGLRHDGQGLRLHAAHRSGLCRARRPGREARQGHQRISRRACRLQPGTPAPSLVVAYHAACSLQHGQRVTRQPKDLLAKSRLRREGRAGRSSVLRLGRHLQYSAARHRKEVARAQSRDYRKIAT